MDQGSLVTAFLRQAEKVAPRFVRRWFQPIAQRLKSAEDMIRTKVASKIPSNDKNVLYAVWDYQLAPSTFDVLNFLCIAEAEREARDLPHFSLIVVPGPEEGFRDNKIHTMNQKRWRLHNILLPVTALQPNCAGVHFCHSRLAAAKLLRKVPGSQLFPNEYTVEAPIAHYNWRLTFAAIAEGKNLQTLRARSEARRIVRDWISDVVKGRLVVTVTLRETPYEEVRNSRLEEFGNFVSKLDKTKILPVILRDQSKVFEPLPPEFDGTERFDPALWNTELRMALYEYADYNLMINNGPFLMAVFSENVQYGVFRMTTEGVVPTSRKWMQSAGWTLDADFPQAGMLQKLYWQDEEAEFMFNECARMLELSENLMRTEFDADWFRQTYPELVGTAALDDAEKIFEVYRTEVCKKPINPNDWFDEAWYRNEYPLVSLDVSDQVLRCGFEHYLKIGKYKHYLPCPGTPPK
ncbi:MAG: hypothetical protein ACPGQM_03075 [Alphaproteobacteria bacterium]